MEVIFEINKHDTATINELKSKLDSIIDTYESQGLDGAEIVAIVVALIPTIKELIMAYFPKKTVTIKISNQYGSAELTARNEKELEVMINKYLEMVEKLKTMEQK